MQKGDEWQCVIFFFMLETVSQNTLNFIKEMNENYFPGNSLSDQSVELTTNDF